MSELCSPLVTGRAARRLGTSLALLGAISLSTVSHAAPGTYGPWGDVDGSGTIDAVDSAQTSLYLLNPGSLTSAQRERTKRYGDVAGVVNQNFIGNGVVNTHDVQRMMILGGGMIDAGTAGAAPTGYGDVNADGRVDILDAVMTQRSTTGLGAVSTANADISPTTPYISFGDGVVDAADLTVITARATGTDANQPAYTDYWPMHLPNLPSGSAQDKYVFKDLSGQSGDFNHETEYRTQAREEVGGYTVTRVDGSDNTSVGVFKGQDGSIYAMYLQYPVAFQGKRLNFSSPVKVLDAQAAAAGSGSWSINLTTDTTDYGIRPTRVKGTILSREDTYTPAAGNFPGGAPPSRWSDSVWVRLDVAMLAIPTSNFDMQQALFFDFAPFIGLVQRGQARVQGAPQPELDKPLTTLVDATVRGIRYNQFQPAP